MIKFCEEQTAKRDDGHANLKELMISSLMSEHLLKVRKDLQIPDNMVKNLLPLSGTLHDSLPHGSSSLLPIPGDSQVDLKALNCIDADLIDNLVSESLTLEEISNREYFIILIFQIFKNIKIYSYFFFSTKYR